MSVRLAPLARPLFRPEEEHLASGEDDVVPPARRRDDAVEEPVARLGTVARDLQAKGLHRLLAARLDDGLLVERRRDAEGVPGAVRVVGDALRADDVLRLY